SPAEECVRTPFAPPGSVSVPPLITAPGWLVPNEKVFVLPPVVTWPPDDDVDLVPLPLPDEAVARSGSARPASMRPCPAPDNGCAVLSIAWNTSLRPREGAWA